MRTSTSSPGSSRGTAAIGLFTFYLVATAWSAARRRDGKPGRIELAAFLWVLGCATALLSFGLLGLADPDGRVDSLPWQVHFVFGSVAMLAALFDLAFLWRGRLDGVQRISRHLWRMCVALLIAMAAGFFTSAGFFSALLLLIILNVVGFILLR